MKIAEKIEDLPPHKAVLLEKLDKAKLHRDSAIALYAQALKTAWDGGISWGMMAVKLGENKVTLWRTVERWKAKVNR